MSRALPPALLLLAYGILFGRAALGGGLLAFDDHPGQLYRLYHAVTLGWAPWRLNPGWWAGYAELQYYPPGAAWLGAAIHQASMGSVGVPAAYQAVLWIAWVLPGIATFALLTRLLGSGWLALPAAFIALTLSAESRSGVEEGLRWGLVAARLGWGLLPLVALSLVNWVEGGRRAPLLAAPLVAAVILLHPAHAPAAFLLVALGACFGAAGSTRRFGQAALVAALALGLCGLWLLPLLAHLGMALPLAWGDASTLGLLRQLATRPLVIVLALSQLGCWLSIRTLGTVAPAARWLHAFTPAMVLVVALDALLAAPLGVLWLPADRLADSLLLSVVLGAAMATRLLAERLPRVGPMGAGAACLFACLVLSGGSPEPSLTLWPSRGQWPKYEEVVRGTRIDALWQALEAAPPGRVLFLRSAVALDYRPEWWRPHSHITGLTPLFSGRPILNGTFTHPSPIAALLYTGGVASGPVTTLVEQRDGATLFGRRLDALSPADFSRWAEHLGVSAVVATDEDQGRVPFLDSNPDWAPPRAIGPFRLYPARTARPLPEPAGPQAWSLAHTQAGGGWILAGFAYSPLWRAEAGGKPVPTRRDAAGMLEVEAPGGDARIMLYHRTGPAEMTGGVLSIASAILLAIGLVTERDRSPSPGTTRAID
ncbi:MAG TPA: hypothetical protein VGV06_07125 [Methylomirabilota bacterium]|nr:hypothetical protein [Methylomirabilota bacterium]